MSEMMRDASRSLDHRTQEAELFGGLYFSQSVQPDMLQRSATGADLYDTLIEEERRRLADARRGSWHGEKGQEVEDKIKRLHRIKMLRQVNKAAAADEGLEKVSEKAEDPAESDLFPAKDVHFNEHIKQ